MAFATIDPATGKTMASYDELDGVGLERALSHAAAAAPAWAAEPLSSRLEVLQRVADGLRAKRAALAALMTLEMGKREPEALAEIDKCAAACEYYVENAARQLADERVATEAKTGAVVWQPLGAVLAIMPWNFPFWQVIRFAAPALAAGNVGLLKHAANVPQCALALAALFREAGAPEGVFQSLFISNDRVAAVIADPRVRAVTLTGSERAGRSVAAAAGKHLKKCVLELGGSDPFVVLDDAELTRTVEVAVTARFQNAGQSCIAAKRFIVVDAVHDAFVERFAAAIGKFECGGNLAPLARHDLRDALHEQVTRSIAAGAERVAGGEPGPGPGAYYEATLLTCVRPGMPAADEELFGPVAAVMRVADEDAALVAANATRYGLGGSVWTADIARGERFARRLECGLAFVNDMVKSDPRLPFGGVKASGYGRELALLGLREFLNAKALWIR